MNTLRLLYFFLIFIGLLQKNSAQVKDTLSILASEDSSRIKVQRLTINSDKSDFSPLLVNNSTLLFVSSRPAQAGLYYTNELNTDITDLFYAAKHDSMHFKKAKPFSKAINSKYNEGPFTFSKDGNTIYFSGNGKGKKGDKEPNRLQIYTSRKINKEWSLPEVASFCNPSYSNCHPAYSEDDETLIFCSDMPGGYGGTDLYMTRFKNGKWTLPVNLGKSINSEANELFPYLSSNSNLYFSSKRSSGLGGLDIYSVHLDSATKNPMLMEYPINTVFDDFGVWLDSTGRSGYFSSNRLKNNDDIYYFNTIYPDFTSAPTPPVKTRFCYSFFEENANQPNDSVSMTYEWDFGNGHKVRSEKCKYCFDKPGNYPIRLNVVEKNSGEVFYNQVTYTMTVAEPARLLISEEDTGMVCGDFILDARKSSLKGYRLVNFYWDFGDKMYAIGPLAKHCYRKKGLYLVELGVTAKNEATQAVEKFKIRKRIVIKENAAIYGKK